ncbi:MAG TPA: SbcC/MukB-like Walker B domain-containing protein, partial [Solirubrobacteraceae bacterium]|nr:SbcC/MukB-like Walker B domain-containing protein [Solirubrobacteraceae bacterium]
ARKQLADATELVERARGRHESVAARMAGMRERQGVLERLIEARRLLAGTESAERKAVAALRSQLDQCGFPDRAAAAAAALPAPQRAALSKAVRDHQDELTHVHAILAQPALQELPEAPADVEQAQLRWAAADQARGPSTELRVTLEERSQRARALMARLERELQDSSELESEFRVLDGLAGTMRGDLPNQLGIPFESFVLAAELEEIVTAANLRLRTMSQGRYAIEHSDERTRGGKRTGLEIVVYDSYTGAIRAPQSLSGGEKFLASLALALGLAEVVSSRAGGIQLDTLFIDEGFGSLDSETLEVAMHTLDELRQGGRVVGLISHVEAMRDRIPAQLTVDVAEGGWSVIRQEALLPANG